MANTYENIRFITNMALRIVRNNTLISRMINRPFESEFGDKSYQIGQSIDIRLPLRATTRVGRTFSAQDQNEAGNFVRLTVDQKIGSDLQFDSDEWVLSAGEMERYLEPKVVDLANTVDRSLMDMYNEIPEAVGSFSTNITPDDLVKAKIKLDQNACPEDKRFVIMDNTNSGKISIANRGLFNPSQVVSEQYKAGALLGNAQGFEVFNTQNVSIHTVGTGAQDPIVVNGAQDNTNILNVSGLAGNLKKGDIFTIANVFKINPHNRVALGSNLRQFVVTADVASGATSIPFAPKLVSAATSVKDQTTAGAASNAAPVVVYGTQGSQGYESIAAHPEFATAAFVKLGKAWGNAETYYTKDEKSPFGIRGVKDYDINTDFNKMRLDMLWGKKVIRPDFATRIRGSIMYL